MIIQAIKIDVLEEKVHLIELPNTLEDIINHIDCNLITAIYPKLPGQDFIFIDDEGLLTAEPKGAFSIIGYYGLYAGNGLVMGSDLDGNNQSCKSTIEEIERKVRFEPIENLPAPEIYIL